MDETCNGGSRIEDGTQELSAEKIVIMTMGHEIQQRLSVAIESLDVQRVLLDLLTFEDKKLLTGQLQRNIVHGNTALGRFQVGIHGMVLDTIVASETENVGHIQYIPTDDGSIEEALTFESRFLIEYANNLDDVKTGFDYILTSVALSMKKAKPLPDQTYFLLAYAYEKMDDDENAILFYSYYIEIRNDEDNSILEAKKALARLRKFKA